MKIAVTTPTGHVGHAVANFLLDYNNGIQVKLLGRRPGKLQYFAKRGAELEIGSMDDVQFLVDATADVDALLWVTPPGYGSDNVRAFQARLGKAAAAAIQVNGIARTVNLSSIGAQFASGLGPISGLHDVETLLDAAAANVTHLRPGFFFENLLWHLDSIKNHGVFSFPLSGSQRYPMIATRDVARAAADRLLDASWTGHSVRELHGAAMLSFDEAAEILSEVAGREIKYETCSRQDAWQFILDNAVSENAANMMLEMYDAMAIGKMTPTQPRSPETTTSTPLAEFAREVITPMLVEPMVR